MASEFLLPVTHPRPLSFFSRVLSFFRRTEGVAPPPPTQNPAPPAQRTNSGGCLRLGLSARAFSFSRRAEVAAPQNPAPPTPQNPAPPAQQSNPDPQLSTSSVEDVAARSRGAVRSFSRRRCRSLFARGRHGEVGGAVGSFSGRRSNSFFSGLYGEVIPPLEDTAAAAESRGVAAVAVAAPAAVAGVSWSDFVKDANESIRFAMNIIFLFVPVKLLMSRSTFAEMDIEIHLSQYFLPTLCLYASFILVSRLFISENLKMVFQTFGIIFGILANVEVAMTVGNEAPKYLGNSMLVFAFVFVVAKVYDYVRNG